MFRFLDFSHRRHPSQRAQRPTPRYRLHLELLEDRTVPSVTLLNTPTWLEQGPGPTGPIANATFVDLNGNGNPSTGDPIDLFRSLGDSADVQTGAVEAIAVDPNNPNHVFVGTVNGGIWQTANVNVTSPFWTTTTDQMPSLAISAIAFSPVNSNILYAGTGNFSSLLGGPFGGTVQADLFGREGGKAVGLYRTLDGGTSWTNIGFNTFNGMNIRSVIPTALNSGQTVFVATSNSRGTASGGIYRSDDSGVTWTRLSGAGANGLPDAAVSHLVSFTTSTGAIGFYSAVVSPAGRGIYRSMDTGLTWQSITNNIATLVTNSARIEFSVSLAGTKPVYAGLIDSNGNLLNILRSVQGTDGFNNNGVGGRDEPAEATWQEIGRPPVLGGQGSVHFSILADKDEATIVYVGGAGSTTKRGNLFRGDAATGVWTSISQPGASNTAPHPDSRDLVFAGSDLLQADDGGIYRLVNPRGLTNLKPAIWHSAIGNLGNTEFVAVALDNQNTSNSADDIILAGAYDNGASQRSAAGKWTEVIRGDGMIVQAVDNIANSVHFFTFQFLGGFSKQADDGNLVAIAGNIADLSVNLRFDTTLPFRTVYQVQATDPLHPQRILVGTSQRLYESLNGGELFTCLGGVVGGTTPTLQAVPGLTGTVTSMAYGSVANPEVAYVGTSTGEIFLRTVASTRNAAGFLKTRFLEAASSGEPLVDHIPLDIVVDPQHTLRAFAVTRTAVFMTNNGMDWVRITGNLAQLSLPGAGINLRTIDLFTGPGPNGTADTADDVVLVGGLGGVFRLLPDTGGPKWSEYGAGLPNVQVTDMEYDELANTLLVGTFGRGAWTLPNIQNTIARESVLQIDGTTGADTITLVRNINSSLLDVFFNSSTPTLKMQLSVVQKIQINTNGDSQADLLEIKSTNGLISVPHGINFLGGLNDILRINNSTDSMSTKGRFISAGNDRLRLTGLLADGLTFSGVAGVTILFGRGDDTFDGSLAKIPLHLVGGLGTDVLTGGGGNDTLNGMDGFPGNDFLIGGPGMDVAIMDSNDTFIGGTGQDGLIISGTPGNDHIRIGRQVGPDGAQIVVQMNGQTQLYNYREGETIFVFAGAGNDHVLMDQSGGLFWRAEFYGEQGNDHLIGSLKNDLLDGGPGNDRLESGGGDDELIGGPGHDIFNGGDGADRIDAADDVCDFVFADVDDLLLGFDPYDQLLPRRRRLLSASEVSPPSKALTGPALGLRAASVGVASMTRSPSPGEKSC